MTGSRTIQKASLTTCPSESRPLIRMCQLSLFTAAEWEMFTARSGQVATNALRLRKEVSATPAERAGTSLSQP